MIDDVFIDNDTIYILHVDYKASTEKEIFVREIAAYDLQLAFQRIYELPEAITMSIESFIVAPWYHKFLVRNNQFLFMVSKPVEHLVAFTPQN